MVDKSLMTSNMNLSNANSTLYKSLLEKVNDAKTTEKATIWNQKANKAKLLSDNMNTYLEGIKKQLKEAADLKIVDGQEKFSEESLEVTTRIFGNGPGGKNLGPDLEKKINQYRTDMLAISPEIAGEFANTISVDKVGPVKGQDGKMKDFTEAYFHMTPTVAALTLVSKFQNNVKNSENQIVTYCHNKVGQVAVHMDQVGVLVGQSSNYVMPGQELTITAGVGAFSSVAKPTISINGSSVPVTNGQGIFKTTASGGGEHTVAVNVTFTDENNVTKTIPTTVKYTVGTPGGAAVMLDKMNVFYIGVDNPVTIGSPTGWEKTSVSMSGGTISGGNDKRTVRVKAVGPASITVTADGKSNTYPFRVKRIPDPVFKIASGKARMPSVEVKNQQYCRAELENFDFDLKYSIVSATVYFSGANFNNVVTTTISGNSLASLASFMSKCGPGSVITFENIKVSGPDGVRSIDGKSIALY